MDKELDQLFEEFDISGMEDETIYRKQAHQVNENFEEKLERVGKKLRFAQDLLALFRYFMDVNVAWQRKTVVVASLLYFISPIDAIPDLAPFVGYLDDFGVILAVTKYMSTELAPYYTVLSEPKTMREEESAVLD
jgi:uncharacterized membrane protein YkvA (DUF1232 family)